MKYFFKLLYIIFITGLTFSCSEEGPHKNNVLKFSAIINNKSENPASASTAQGRALFEYNKSMKELKYNINYQNIVPTAVTINIDAGAPRIVYGLTINPAGNQALGTISNVTEGDQAALINGQMYVNITSTIYPAGEIRGKIVLNDSKY
jgi:hypothetical protein